MTCLLSILSHDGQQARALAYSIMKLTSECWLVDIVVSEAISGCEYDTRLSTLNPLRCSLEVCDSIPLAMNHVESG